MADDDAGRLRELVERIVADLGLRARVEVTATDEELRADVVGEELGLFIGRHGQTIDAVQHLAARILVGPDDQRQVVVDAAGYRERRRAALVEQANRAAFDAGRNRRPVALDAMSPLERRIVHEHLRDRDDVETYSEGHEPERHIVVAPAGR